MLFYKATFYCFLTEEEPENTTAAKNRCQLMSYINNKMVETVIYADLTKLCVMPQNLGHHPALSQTMKRGPVISLWCSL